MLALLSGGLAQAAEAEKQIADCLALLEVQKSREAEQRAAAAAATSGEGTPPFAGTPGGATSAGTGAVAPGGAVGGAPAGSGGMSTQKKLGIAAVGIGALGVGIGVTAFFLGKSYLDTARDMGCTDQLCTGKAKDEYNKAQTAITISNIGGISGAVLLIGGVVLILTAPSSTPASGVALVPVVGPGQAQLALTGTF
jgi:hypothetical protein